jgi:hypothetical protein
MPVSLSGRSFTDFGKVGAQRPTCVRRKLDEDPATVEAARLEVQALRLGRRYQMMDDIDPKCTEPLPWKRSGTDGC